MLDHDLEDSLQEDPGDGRTDQRQPEGGWDGERDQGRYRRIELAEPLRIPSAPVDVGNPVQDLVVASALRLRCQRGDDRDEREGQGEECADTPSARPGPWESSQPCRGANTRISPRAAEIARNIRRGAAGSAGMRNRPPANRSIMSTATSTLNSKPSTHAPRHSWNPAMIASAVSHSTEPTPQCRAVAAGVSLTRSV